VDTTASTPAPVAPAAPALRLRPRLALGLQALIVFAALVALFAVVQYAVPGLADHDGYYHMRWSQIIRAQGLKPPFVWLPLSILNAESYYDHHLLFHIYLAVFAGDPDPAALVAGAKLASTLLPALAGVAVWWLLRGQGVPWAGLWAVGLLAVSAPFLYRLSMPRAQSASLLVLVLGLHWLLQRRYWALLPLGFAYVWLYDAFPLLLVLAGVYTAAAWATAQGAGRRVEWQALAWPAAGLALGLVLNPYFPQNLDFIAHHLLAKLAPTSVPVGNEWYPYETWTLAENSGPALAAFALGALAMAWQARRPSRAALTTFGLAVVFGVMVLRSRRFVEYYPAFALIFLAVAAGPLLAGWQAALAARPGGRVAALALWLLPVGLAVAVAVPGWMILNQARALMGRSRPPTLYAGASAWLSENAPAGSLVFQTDWDDFPRLFFYNPGAIYTAGLDPTYFERYDEALYRLWVRITQGRVSQPGEVIRDRFGAAYVMSDLAHRDFIDVAEEDPLLEQVYLDNEAIVFVVLPK
jgi:hypothetical protein